MSRSKATNVAWPQAAEMPRGLTDSKERKVVDPQEITEELEHSGARNLLASATPSGSPTTDQTASRE